MEAHNRLGPAQPYVFGYSIRLSTEKRNVHLNFLSNKTCTDLGTSKVNWHRAWSPFQGGTWAFVNAIYPTTGLISIGFISYICIFTALLIKHMSSGKLARTCFNLAPSISWICLERDKVGFKQDFCSEIWHFLNVNNVINFNVFNFIVAELKLHNCNRLLFNTYNVYYYP